MCDDCFQFNQYIHNRLLFSSSLCSGIVSAHLTTCFGNTKRQTPPIDRYRIQDVKSKI
jgi:hypothetical protein